MAKYTNFFTDTDVPTFRVPYSIVGNNLEVGVLGKLSHPALRLYLAMLSKCGHKNRPIVEMTTEYIERHAGISEKKVSEVRGELEDAFLIRFTKENGIRLYELLQPETGGLPLLVATPPKTPLINDSRGPNLSSGQIETVFRHYLKGSHLFDDENGLRFRCPFHEWKGDAKRAHLSVGQESGGPWMCQWRECRHNGCRRPRPAFEDGVMDLVGRIAYDGGGNALDFIVAMVELQTGTIIDRKEAEGIMADILAL